MLSISFEEGFLGGKDVQKWLSGWGEFHYSVEVKDKEAHISITIKKKKEKRQVFKAVPLNQSFPLYVEILHYFFTIQKLKPFQTLSL